MVESRFLFSTLIVICIAGAFYAGSNGFGVGSALRPMPTGQYSLSLPSTGCQNGIMDAGEEGIDCGGPCNACRPSCQLGGQAAVSLEKWKNSEIELSSMMESLAESKALQGC
jgi:hypothetical protein